MDDAEAYMLLALANTQGELTTLERGRHALAAVACGVEPDVKAYATSVKRAENTVRHEVQAARVAEAAGTHVGVEYRLLSTPHALSTLHAAPCWLWRVPVERTIEEGWTVARAQKAVEAVKGAPELEPWWDVGTWRRRGRSSALHTIRQ